MGRRKLVIGQEGLKRLWLRVHECGLALCKGWQAMTGEDAYARYLQHHQSHHPETTPMDEASFWRAETDRRYRGIRRCC